MRLARRALFAVVLTTIVLGLPDRSQAGDWPQILGPNRNGVASGERLEKLWNSPKGPKTLWQKSVGSGLAGVAVAKNVTYVVHRLDDRELLEAVDAVTGRDLWKTDWSSDYQDTIAGDDGPRCVPLVHGEFVFALGAAGTLACVKSSDGTVVWSKNIVDEYQSPKGYFGVGSTPVIDSGVLIVNVGGKQPGTAIVGFDPQTGRELWKAASDTASYSAPVAAVVDGTRHVLVISRLKLTSLDPTNGKVRFEFPFGQRGPTVNGASPMVFKDHLILTASYGIGATLAKIGKSRAEIVFEGDEILSSQYSTPVFDGTYLYASEGRQDQGQASIRCLDPLNKKILWEKKDFGLATPILVDKKILWMKSDGSLIVSAASPDGYEELAEASLFTSTTRALPAFSNGRLYVRDTKTLKCFELKP